jgi:hypothetical protein
MELTNFANAVAGLNTLAELERRDPKLAAGLETLVEEVVDVCDKAYGRFAETLGQVVALEDVAPSSRRDAVQKRLREAHDHDWFKQVAKICARLGAVDDAFSGRLQQIAVAPGVSASDRRSLGGLIHLLSKHEHDIEDDIRLAAGEVARLIAEAATRGNAGPARAKAQDVLNEISGNMKALLDVRVHILASARRGTNNIVLKATEARRAPSVHFVIVTALEEELQAVLAQLKNCKRLPPTKEDVRVYYQCRVKTRLPDGSDGAYSAVILSLLSMGRVEAATAAGDAIRRWHPQYVLLVGIAGGIADASVSLGDVIVSDQIVDYEVQKVTPKGPAVRYSVTAPTRGCWLQCKPSGRTAYPRGSGHSAHNRARRSGSLVRSQRETKSSPSARC